jgi:putative ABC transport system permease protein
VVVNNVVTPGYFEAVGMRLRAGRSLTERDRNGAPRVAVVNEAFMRRYAGGAPPLGRKFGQNAPVNEIVGVVEDARALDVKSESVPMAYFPLQQRTEGTPRSIEIRAEGDPRQIAAAVRKTIGEVESRLPIEGVTTASERVRSNLTQDRLLLSLFSAFGGLALALAGFGLFGLLSYAVARRREEFGIRMALGASPAAVLWTVIRESLLLACAGLAAGLPLVIVGTNLMRGVLFGVSPWDGVTIGVAAALLIAVAAVAGFLPAWRASRVDPLTALRSE